MRILIVEDDELLSEELSKLLNTNGYETKRIIIFDDLINQVIESCCDLILLDVNLPFNNGFEICKMIRKGSDVPIMFVTSRDQDEDELKSIICGGNDYVTKPYNKMILLEKIKRIEALVDPLNHNEISINGVTLNLPLSCLRYGDKKIELTRNEFRVAYYLFINSKRTISKEELLEYLWNDKYYLDENILSVTITRLRSKAKELGINNFIKTIRKKGYQL